MDLNKRRWFGGTAEALRPPWLLDPEGFTDQCTRCGNCLTLCKEQILRAGSGGFPVVDFSFGECTFCGDCTTGCEESLFSFEPDNREQAWSHVAKVSDHCLTGLGVMCRSCEDACEPRAIRFTLSAGVVPQPQVDTSLCTGCGACIRPCPEQAISMTVATS